MARVWNEKFETSDYDETWSVGESTEGLSTIVQNTATSEVSSPTQWGAQCLKCVSVGTTDEQAYVAHNPSWSTAMHFRDEFVITSEDLADTNQNVILKMWNSGAVDPVMEVQVRQDSGVLHLRVGVNHDGTGLSFTTGVIALSLNTRYRWEGQFDITNDIWEWKIDGTSEASGTLTNPATSHPTDIGVLRLGAGIASNDEAMTIYHDLVAVDDLDWVGVEGAPKFLYHNRHHNKAA